MIKNIVVRRHVGESMETVIRYVISRLQYGFEGYRSMTTAEKTVLVSLIMKAHWENRGLYYSVIGGI